MATGHASAAERQPEISVVIVNWNTGDLLRECLDALPAAAAALPIEVVVVDNASSDQSIRHARGSAQSFRLIALDRNTGFARANNRALKDTRGALLLFLNPDAALRPGSLVSLRDFFAQHPRASIVGAKLRHPDGTLQPSVRRFPTTGVLLLLLTRLARLFPDLSLLKWYEARDLVPSAPTRVEQVMGACLAVRRSTLDRVGGFDPCYHLWFEEVDLCRRVVRAGGEVWFVPGVEAVHHRAASFRKLSPLRRAREFSRSAVRYARKHLGWFPALLVLAAVPLALLTALPVALGRAGSALAAGRADRLRRGRPGLLLALGIGAVALFLGLFFSALGGLLLLAGAWIAAGTWRYPWAALLLLFAVTPFLLLLKVTVALGALTLLKDVVIGTLFVRVLSHGGPRVPSALAFPVLAMAAWWFIAFARADAPVLGLLRLRDLLLYVPLLLIVRRLVTTAERRRTLLYALGGTLGLVLVLGFAQWEFFPGSMVQRFDPVRAVWVPRLASVLAHPNILGAYLLLNLPLAAAVALAGPPRDRLGAVLLLLGSLAGVAFTYSRSAWLATGAFGTAFLILALALRRPRLLFTGVLLASLGLGLATAHPMIRAVLFRFADPAYASNRARLDFIQGSLAQLSATGAVVGEGLGDTTRLLGRNADISLYQVVAARAREAQVAKARTFLDNAVAKTIIEQGVVGLVLAGWVAVRAFLLCLRKARQGADALSRSLGLGLASLLPAVAVLWFFLDVPDLFPANLLFWAILGVGVSEARPKSSGNF